MVDGKCYTPQCQMHVLNYHESLQIPLSYGQMQVTLRQLPPLEINGYAFHSEVRKNILSSFQLLGMNCIL